MKSFFRMTSVVAVWLLLNSHALAQDGAVSEQDREAIEARLEQIVADIAELRTQRSSRNQQLDTLFGDLAGLEQQLRDTRELIQTNRGYLEVANQELAELEVQADASQQRLDVQQAQLGEQLNAAYRLGRQSRLKLLLNLESATDLTRMLAYHERFSQQRAELISGIQSELDVLAAARAGIQQRRDQIRTLDQEYEQELARLEQQQQQRQSLVTDIRAELGNLDNRISELQLNQEELETLLANLQDLFADIPEELNTQPFAELRGQLAWPVRSGNPSVSTRFGQARTAGVVSSGIFIDLSEDQPVFAVAHGRVAFADWLRGFGWLVIIDHNDGYMSLYGNNSQLQVAAGSWVSAGETVAVSGSGFGADQRSGVYFELRRDGRAYNPEPWLANP